jgi:hypothetical protein
MQSHQSYQLKSRVSNSEPHFYSSNISKHVIHLFIVFYIFHEVNQQKTKIEKMELCDRNDKPNCS